MCLILKGVPNIWACVWNNICSVNCILKVCVAAHGINMNIISLQVPVEVRKTIGRLRNCIKLLSHHSIMISPTSVMTAFDMSIEQEFEVSCILFGALLESLIHLSVTSLLMHCLCHLHLVFIHLTCYILQSLKDMK